jgi:hypothetical protein
LQARGKKLGKTEGGRLDGKMRDSPLGVEGRIEAPDGCDDQVELLERIKLTVSRAQWTQLIKYNLCYFPQLYLNSASRFLFCPNFAPISPSVCPMLNTMFYSI